LGVLALFAAGTAVGMFMGRREFATPAAIGNIVWKFEQTAPGNGYFLNMQRVGTQELRIYWNWSAWQKHNDQSHYQIQRLYAL
jgi:hypothetical protein